jgi:hypothetical protein
MARKSPGAVAVIWSEVMDARSERAVNAGSGRSATFLGAVAGSVLLLRAPSAEAGSFALEWDAPKECPDASFVESEVTRVVGRPWQELGAQWRKVSATITAEAGGYRLRMSVVPHAGLESQRSILGASCTEATEAAVAILTAGMGLGDARAGVVGGETLAGTAGGGQASTDGALSTDGSASMDGTASTEQAAPLDDGRSDTPAASERESAPARTVLVANVGLDFGTLAAVAPFAQLWGGFELDRFVLLGFVGATGSVVGEVGGGRAGAQMFLLMGGVAGCVLVTQSGPVVSGCGGIEVGSLEASGFGAAESRDGRAFWSAGVLRAALDWHITGPTVLSAGVNGVFPMRQLHVALNPEEVHQTPAVAVRPWLGLGWRFE